MFIGKLGILLIAFLLFFFLWRGIIRIYLNRVLPRGQRKKMSKKQSFCAWVFYSNYKDTIPKWLKLCYHLNLLAFFILIILITVFTFTYPVDISGTIIWNYFVVNSVLLITSRFVLKLH